MPEQPTQREKYQNPETMSQRALSPDVVKILKSEADIEIQRRENERGTNTTQSDQSHHESLRDPEAHAKRQANPKSQTPQTMTPEHQRLGKFQGSGFIAGFAGTFILCIAVSQIYQHHHYISELIPVLEPAINYLVSIIETLLIGNDTQSR